MSVPLKCRFYSRLFSSRLLILQVPLFSAKVKWSDFHSRVHIWVFVNVNLLGR